MLAERAKAGILPREPRKGFYKLYTDHALSAMKGAGSGKKTVQDRGMLSASGSLAFRAAAPYRGQQSGTDKEILIWKID